MPLILPGNVASATAAVGYSIDNSCRFNAGDSPRLSKSISSTNTTWTFSAWVKRAGITNHGLISWGASAWTAVFFGATADSYLQFYDTASATNPNTHANYRDTAAWYHIVVKNNAGTITFYVNGEVAAHQGGSTGTALFSTTLYVGSVVSSNYGDFYMAEVFFIDGTAYAASTFGEFDSDSPTIWKPKDCSGDLTFGTDGFWLDFKASGNLGNDANGGTDLTETNIVAADQATDTPTNNFCTMNPLDNYRLQGTYTEGNCKVATRAADPSYGYSSGTLGASAGKWYWEVKLAQEVTATNYMAIGIAGRTSDTNDGLAYGDDAVGFQGNDGQIRDEGTVSSYGSAYEEDDIIGVAMDLDNNKLYFAKNGTWENSGDPTSGATGTGAHSIDAASTTSYGFYMPAVGDHAGASYSNAIFEMNIGGCPAFAISSGNADGNGYGNFEYAPPSGYYALCTKNLAEFG